VSPGSPSLICDISKQAVRPGDVLWSNREHDIDILNQSMPIVDAGSRSPLSMDSGPRYHASFPNVPLTRFVVPEGGPKMVCDLTNQAVRPGDVLWSNREGNVDILEQAMPAVDVRFHQNFPGVPLYKALITPAEEGKWICDVTNTPARVGDVIWSSRANDVDVLDVAFQSAAPQPPAAASRQPPAGLAPLISGRRAANAVDALNQMGLELLEVIIRKPQNTFISPLSISLALSMTANGAQGATLDGMMKALCAADLGGLKLLNGHMHDLTSVLKSSDPRVTFLLANSLWSRNLLETFISTCASIYQAEAVRQAPTPEPINKWCADKTQNKISEVVSPPLDPEGAVLVNALYFKGEWKSKFDAELTRPAPFFDAFGGREDCQMMTAKGNKKAFDYQETDTYQMVCLPYGDTGEYSATIVLPRKDASKTLNMETGPHGCVPGAARNPQPATVAEVLTDLATEWKESLQRTKGRLLFPRFKVESGFEMKPLLEARGMDLAFSGMADFGNMSSTSLAIDAVIHKTFVEVNEEGTEAAAVTAVVMSRGISLPRPEPEFIMVCNRPFLFFIRHDSTKAIIFAGVIAKPE